MSWSLNMINIDVSLFEYVTNKMNEQVRKTELPISDDTLCYVGNLLTTFCQSTEFLIVKQNRNELPTLAFLYKDARETNNMRLKLNLLRKLGDSALFLGAWFSYFYNKKGIGKDYFIGMGTAAYDFLANNSQTQRDVFNELAGNLPTVLSLTSHALEKDGTLSTQEIFNLYQKYLETKDDIIRQQLESLGINLSNQTIYVN